MQIKCRMDHYNFNVLNLEKSIEFYEKALGLKEKRRKAAEDGSFIIVYMAEEETDFTVELTWLKEWDRPYELGDNEVHLCVRVEGDYAAIREFHRENGWVCFENTNMGLYFINDPDDHWIEILKKK